MAYFSSRFVGLPLLTKETFTHLPGLASSQYVHLFLSRASTRDSNPWLANDLVGAAGCRWEATSLIAQAYCCPSRFATDAWPLGQDVCKLIKQRCREICPSLIVFLDVEDLTSGYGAESVDSSQCILVFAMPVYFEKINCVRELVRAIVREKPIALLLPDAEVHGELTQAMIREMVTDMWLEQWKLAKLLAEWATEWSVAELQPPTAADMCDALFKQPPLEWSRLTPFQDHTMVLMCQRLLPEAERDIYLQGASSFTLPKRHRSVKVYCSPHNPGARELAVELNGVWPQLLEFGEDVGACDHMLVYLNAVTWAHNPEALTVDISEAQRLGVHLQLCHEFPSVMDPGSPRKALGFKQIMDTTPSDITSGESNIYKQIAIPLKGGKLREVGLAAVAAKLATLVSRTTATDAGRRHTSRGLATGRFASRRFTTQASVDASSGVDHTV
jgi:hypothetical protein|eukprot:4652297-Prymnesium_polylepis.3